jgi:SAM-dependent methyltransferase
MMNDQTRSPATPGQSAGGWQESDSAAFLDLGRILTPGRDEIARVLRDLVPARSDEPFVFVDIGTGQGWLSQQLLGHFAAAQAIALDGSPTMLRHAAELLAPFAGRFELRPFRLEEPAWLDALGSDIRCFLSSLVIHHLDGPAKQKLFAAIYRHLAPGGALLIADIVAPTSEQGRHYLAHAWDEEVRRQSLEFAGDLRAYGFFIEQRWNIYNYPDPTDIPSSVPEQLGWLAEAGFSGIDVFWLRAGHAVFGGYKPTG